MEPTTFTTEDGVRLEGEFRRPDGEPRGSAVLCHPHPRQGGSKDHPILWALRNELASTEGLVVLGFNFRGVMGSGGGYGGGRDELRDVRAAIDHVRREAPELPILVCGWSFGANVAVREAIDDERVTALALIGMPLVPGDLTLPALPEPAELRAMRRPILLLCGEEDGFCPPEQARRFADAVPSMGLEVLPDTDHYLWRHEKEAASLVGGFARRVL